MKKTFALAVAISLTGCIVSASSENQDVAELSGAAPDAGIPAQCTEIPCSSECDCFDDNMCTQDSCVNGVCVNRPIDGTCGGIGVCLDTWCCTSEYTCFLAYDTGSACAPPKPKCQYDVECAHMTAANCVVGACANGECRAEYAQDGSFCVPSLGENPGVCFSGNCVEDILCDDGNECTDDFVNPDGVCSGVTTYVFSRSCTFNAHDGICANGECTCNSDDDCDDNNTSTADFCLDLICFHQ